MHSTDGFLRRATHLVHDRDPVFAGGFGETTIIASGFTKASAACSSGDTSPARTTMLMAARSLADRASAAC